MRAKLFTSAARRERWRTAGRHGDIVARTYASVPALATRGDLVQLKAHANRFLLAKLVRCWAAIAAAFGVEHHQAENEVREAMLTAGIWCCEYSGVSILIPLRDTAMCTWS